MRFCFLTVFSFLNLDLKNASAGFVLEGKGEVILEKGLKTKKAMESTVESLVQA